MKEEHEEEEEEEEAAVGEEHVDAQELEGNLFLKSMEEEGNFLFLYGKEIAIFIKLCRKYLCYVTISSIKYYILGFLNFTYNTLNLGFI